MRSFVFVATSCVDEKGFVLFVAVLSKTVALLPFGAFIFILIITRTSYS